MAYRKTTVLVPSHSLEDFPTDLGDEAAASLLNCFAVAWHPELIAETGFLPSWRRADDPPPPPYEGQIILVPTPCEGWMSHGWIEQTREQGGIVAANLHQRDDLLAALSLESSEVDPELTADFLALGTCWLLTELLMRHMRNFGNIDEARLQNRVVAAARAAVAHDRETADIHLRAAFEILQEARERFYPVEAYLLDLCLMVPEQANDAFRRELAQSTPFSVMATSADWAEICAQHPDVQPEIQQAESRGIISFVGGEEREVQTPLLSLNSALWQWETGRQTFLRLWQRSPKVWGRRRYGLCAALPQILTKFGFQAALHVAFDDGIYPDHEHTKLRWQGCDGTVINALSRIPLAAESAASFLRFPARMSESMDHDQVAGIVFARWPEVQSPWFHDFRRIAKYAPVLGRFVTLEQFFAGADSPGRLATYDSKEYFSPYFIQAVARREVDPISQYAKQTQRRQTFDAALWCRATARALLNQPVEDDTSLSAERVLESAATPVEEAENVSHAEHLLQEISTTWPRELSQLVMHGAGTQPGYLVINPLSFPRIAAIELSGLISAPATQGSVKGVQFDSNQKLATVLVDLPACGFVWIGGDEQASLPSQPKLPMAENNVLRNDFFEVVISEETGGIRQIRMHNTRGNRLSQQLSYRFPREKTIPARNEHEHPEKTQYARSIVDSLQILSTGPMMGKIQSEGQILDPADHSKLASFTQTTWVHRFRPVVEVEIVLRDLILPEGDPWNNTFVSRFAWNDPTAAITRSLWQMAQPVGGERYESSDYLEIAEDQDRATIIPHGLPFHRRTGPRMLDSLLVVEGETQRTFRFTIAVDQHYPLQASWNATIPPLIIPTESGPPRMGRSGWFYHLDAKHVQILKISGLPSTEDAPSDEIPKSGFTLRVLETEGRAGPVHLQMFKTPTSARKRDFTGTTLIKLPISGDAVVIDLAAYEVAEIELLF